HHGDHTRGALGIAERFSVPIMAHKNALHHLKFKVDKILADGEVIIRDDHICLKALFTPGHADDHLAYYDEPNEFLIAGDMITDRGTVLIPPLQGDLATYLKSLTALSLLRLKVIVPAHGHAIVDKATTFLLLAMKHRYERINAALSALSKAQNS